MSTLQIHTTGKANFVIILRWPADELDPHWPIEYKNETEQLLLVSDTSFGADEDFLLSFCRGNFIVGDGILDINDTEVIASYAPDTKKIQPDMLEKILQEHLPDKIIKINQF